MSPDGIERPHLDGLPAAVRQLILEDVARRQAEDPGLSDEAIEKIGRLVQKFRLAGTSKNEDVA